MNCTIVYCINFLSNEAAIDNLRRLKSICDTSFETGLYIVRFYFYFRNNESNSLLLPRLRKLCFC